MAELLQKLGVDWRLIIAQMVNFFILLGLLYKFLYKPLLKVLEERRERVDKSIEQAKLIEENMARATRERQEEIAKARLEAGRIMEEAKLAATAHRNKLMVEAQSESDKIVKQAEASLQAEKAAMLGEAKLELAALVMNTTEKVLRGTMTEAINKHYIEEVVRDLK